MRIAIAIVVALGLAIGLLWTGDQAPAPARIQRKATQESTRTVMSRGAPPVLTTPALRTLEPRASEPALRKEQQDLWRDLRAFAAEARLTDSQWERFQRDLSELAAIESAARATAHETDDYVGLVPLSRELAHELVARASEYMTKDQLLTLKPSARALVTRVRQLHYVSMSPEN